MTAVTLRSRVAFGGPDEATHAAGLEAAELAAARALFARGHTAAARRRLIELAAMPPSDPAGCLALARALHDVAAYHEALMLLRNAGADDTGALAVMAASVAAMGDLAGAEALFDRLISRSPSDGAAWYDRATLRRWTPNRNHMDALQRALRRPSPDAEIPLRYAMAKELEDQGRHAESFAHLALGSAMRRGRLRYSVEADAELMQTTARAFDAQRVAGVARTEEPGPIFVLGLPRAGGALVDRILGAHSQVTSLGETPDLALTLEDVTSRQEEAEAFVWATALGDPRRLAARWRERVAGHEAPAPFVVDSTPENFLHVGLIGLALPEARIVHVRRGAMDVGYALFKALFRTGGAYSYDLHEIGGYIAAYGRLMDHWRTALPGRMIEVDYEALVEDLPGQARRLVEACGLPWESACAAAPFAPDPSAPPGAIQGFAPVEQDPVDLAHAYEVELLPLRRALAAEGVL
jgi:tetratricopeptide (TPR) repeat protein